MEFNQFIQNALQEDIGSGDHSTLASIDANVQGKAILKVKEEGIIAGVEIAKEIFKILEPTCILNIFIKDGEKVKVGDIAFELQAKVHNILKGEGLVLIIM